MDMKKELGCLVYIYKEDITSRFNYTYCKKCLAYTNELLTKQIDKSKK